MIRFRLALIYLYIVSRATNYEIRSLKFTASSDRSDCRFDKFAIALRIKASCDSPRIPNVYIFALLLGALWWFAKIFLGLFRNVVVTKAQP